MITEDQLQAFRTRQADEHEEVSLHLLKALYLIRREINLLRAEHGLPPRTVQQVVNAFRAVDLTDDS